MGQEIPENRPRTFEEGYRLYLDESGDHVFKKLDEDSHRYLCLLGCWFKNPAYLAFHEKLEQFKKQHVPAHPDEPIILHREEIINRRGIFGRLCDSEKRTAFDEALLQLIRDTDFRLVAVVIDKLKLHQSYGVGASHPYHLGMGFLLQRYCGFLNHTNRVGDMMAESRGGTEDRLLKDSYNRVFERGVFTTSAEHFQHALTSRQLKIKPKSANISGLQLADLLGHPVKQKILRAKGLIRGPVPVFAGKLLEITETKWNHQLYDGRIEGYGWVVYPK
ncbi:MAG: DUF3800 domain-containing protein [Deltaproteobacteria bacterium]|nr:DUF3800 domain-containing protein [Deltaproteobacteria bacterium]